MSEHNLFAVVAALATIGAMGGGRVIRLDEDSVPPMPDIQPKRRADSARRNVPRGKPTKPELPPGPVTRQQRRAAERAALKRLPA